MKLKTSAYLLMFITILFASGCSGIDATTSGSLKASGTTSVTTIQVAPEISGKIDQINVAKGDTVNAGEVLFRLDNQLLQAQLDQVKAAVQAAQANLDLATNKQTSAQAQHNLALQVARQQYQLSYFSDWMSTPPDKVSVPGWYFEKNEQISAMQVLVDAAQKNLESEITNLNTVLHDVNNQNFINAEQDLAQAEQAYNIAQTTLNDAKAAKDTTNIQDSAQNDFDLATTELDSAQTAYNQMLSTDEASKVLETRANVAVARDRLNNTQLAMDKLLAGDNSLQVKTAQTGLDQAKSGVAAAQASVNQAQAALQLATIELDKTTITSTVAGTVLDVPLNAGEVAAAGATVVEVGDLDQVTLDVYIPENQYGQVKLGMSASIAVDSFPGMTFTGKVTYISDQAEFTPRTVQTVDSRSTTVYKVEITIPNPNHDLKPGMPADATIYTG